MEVKTIGQLLLGYREKVNELRSLLNRKSLTQGELADEIGVSEISIGNWERDVNRPGAKHLKSLIKLYLSDGAFSKGKEEEAAKELWEVAGRNEPFDEEWFRGLPKSKYRPFRGNEEQLLQRALAMNPRGVSLLDAIESVGLVDIENRNEDLQILPPEQFYEMAKKEIVITGLSTYRTFEQKLDSLRAALNAGKTVRVLILYPDLKLIEEQEDLSTRERIDILNAIKGVLSIIRLEKLDQEPGFEIRFMNKLPSFTAVMIDGDVEPEEKLVPQDAQGQIRVQPGTLHGTQHKGVILQFKKKREKPEGAFDYFAADVRVQWRKGTSLKEVLTKMG
jgi:transcriptional regulator with XRE-family HTH domain